MTTPGFDVTHVFIASAPPGQLAGYTTGSGGIAWTAADWAAHPGAIHIDQDAAASDGTADVLDVEHGAATPAECPGWVKRAIAAVTAGTRPGQRKPAIYCSANTVTAVVNALVAGGVSTGCGLWIANWNLTSAEAVSAVKAAAGPFPIIGVQFADPGNYDDDQFSSAWLANVSAKPPVHTPAPPVTGIQSGWKWCGKCNLLVWGPAAMAVKCPQGGRHDIGTWTYAVPFSHPG